MATDIPHNILRGSIIFYALNVSEQLLAVGIDQSRLLTLLPYGLVSVVSSTHTFVCSGDMTAECRGLRHNFSTMLACENFGFLCLYHLLFFFYSFSRRAGLIVHNDLDIPGHQRLRLDLSDQGYV